jgi:hypothetical protein
MFSWRYYLARYKDLTDAGIATEAQAVQHWNMYGKTENREGCPSTLDYYKNIPNPRKVWLDSDISPSPVGRTLTIINAVIDSNIRVDCLLNNIPYFQDLGTVIVKGEIKIPYRHMELSRILQDPQIINVYDMNEYERVITTDDSYLVIRPLKTMSTLKTGIVKAILQGQEFVPISHLNAVSEVFSVLGISMPTHLVSQ